MRQNVFRELTRPRETDESVDRDLGAFVQNGQLLGFSAQRPRRRAVLEHVARAFEPGVRRSEKEVDAVLRQWCPGGAVDHVTRRYLVDEGVLDRTDA